MLSDVVKLTYEEITHVTQSPIIYWMIIFAWFLAFIISVIFMAKTKSGKTKMIAKKNAWFLILIFTLSYAFVMLLFIIFPVWTKIL